jgi:hypothetical protein
MSKRWSIGLCILAVIATWVFWLTKPPPSQAQRMGAIIDAVNHRQETVSQGEVPEEVQKYLETLFEAIANCNFEGFRQLTHLRANSKQLDILCEIFFEGKDFCPATIIDYRRTRDTEEDQTIFPVDWRPSSLERHVRIYSGTRRIVRVHSEKRARDYNLVLYDTTAGLTLLLAGEAK